MANSRNVIILVAIVVAMIAITQELATAEDSSTTSAPSKATTSLKPARHPHDLHIEALFEKAKVFPKELEKAQERFHEAWQKFKDLFPKADEKKSE